MRVRFQNNQNGIKNRRRYDNDQITHNNFVENNRGNNSSDIGVDDKFCQSNLNTNIELINNDVAHTSPTRTQAMISLSHVDAVLLQTERAQVTDLNYGLLGEFRLLFDSGAQLNYISPKARSQLQLRYVAVHQVTLKTFGKIWRR